MQLIQIRTHQLPFTIVYDYSALEKFYQVDFYSFIFFPINIMFK